MHIILFDGICNLCNGIVSFIIKRDKKALFHFAAIQSEAGQLLLEQWNVGKQQNNTLYYIREGRCFQKSAAVIYILVDLGGVWKCLYPFIYFPPCLRDSIYHWIAKHRYEWFGKKENCKLLEKEIKNRFIV